MKLQVYTKPTEDLLGMMMKSAGPMENPKGMIVRIDWIIVIRDFADFLDKCFMLDPDKRISPQDALRHPFLAMNS